MQIKRILMLLFCAGIIGSALIGPRQAHAQDTSNPKATFFEGLVQMIAQKFNLDKNKVQSVVNEYQDQQKSKMSENLQEREDNRLSQLVKEGKITSAQKVAIEKELATLKSKYNFQNLKNLTPAERKTQMQNFQNELKTWAESQGINLAYVGRFGFGMGMRGGMHKGQWLTPTP